MKLDFTTSGNGELWVLTLQVEFVLRALQEDGADGVQVVVGVAAQWPSASLGHLQHNHNIRRTFRLWFQCSVSRQYCMSILDHSLSQNQEILIPQNFDSSFN